MSDSLKTSFLFIRLHLTVNEGYHQPNIDMKSDQTLSDLKSMKFSKKKAQIEFDFLY